LYTAIKDANDPSLANIHAYSLPPYSWLETLTATTVAFVVGLAVIAFLMRYLKSRSFLPFVIYRIALGGTLLALLGAGVIQG
jgi:undecaprenyl-diphosphatase